MNSYFNGDAERDVVGPPDVEGRHGHRAEADGGSDPASGGAGAWAWEATARSRSLSRAARRAISRT